MTTARQPTWTAARVMATDQWWTTGADAYARRLGSQHRAVGATMAWQHAVSHLMRAWLLRWAYDGHISAVTLEGWQLRLDPDNAALEARALHDAGIPAASVGYSARNVGGLLARWLLPALQHGVTMGPVTEKTLWGCAASTVVASLSTCLRAVPRDDVAHFGALVEPLFQGFHSESQHGALLSMQVSYQPMVVLQHRQTCCLMRLGSAGSTCSTCPIVPVAQSGSAQLEAAKTYPPWPTLNAYGLAHWGP